MLSKELVTNKPGFVYILQSEVNSRFYVGSTMDVEKRFNEHQNGNVRFTRNIRPLQLKFFTKLDNIKKARQMEYRLKKLKSREIIERIIQEQDIRLKLD